MLCVGLCNHQCIIRINIFIYVSISILIHCIILLSVITVDARQLMQELDSFTCPSLAEYFPAGSSRLQIGRIVHKLLSDDVNSTFRGSGSAARATCL